MACPSGQTMFRTEGGISTSFVTWSVDLAGATARWPSGSAGSKEVRPVLWEPPTTHAIGAGCSCSFVSVTRLTGMQVHVTEKNTYDVNSLKINIYIYIHCTCICTFTEAHVTCTHTDQTYGGSISDRKKQVAQASVGHMVHRPLRSCPGKDAAWCESRPFGAWSTCKNRIYIRIIRENQVKVS